MTSRVSSQVFFCLLTFTLSLLVFIPNQAFSAACCGGGTALPSLITGDDRAQITVSSQYAKTHDQVLPNSRWRRLSDSDFSELKFDGAMLISDRWQAGFSFGANQYTQSGTTAPMAHGDLTATLGFEALPEYTFSALQPHVFTFASVTAPTGRSIYDGAYQAEELHGRGFWSTALGAIALKSWSEWDASFSFSLAKSYARTDQTTQQTIDPGLSFTSSLGGGWNTDNTRTGLALSTSYEDAIKTETETGSLKRVTTATASFAYLFKNDSMLALSLSEQSLFGSPLNTPLNTTLALSWQIRWPR